MVTFVSIVVISLILSVYSMCVVAKNADIEMDHLLEIREREEVEARKHALK